jgi:ferrous iron transport protein A
MVIFEIVSQKQSPFYTMNTSSTSDSFTLAQLPIGKRGVVVDLPYGNSCMTRLRELGILPKTAVEVLRRAPLGDPLEISVRGCLLSLRQTEAEQIEVEFEH